ncbi:hypothetical protein QYE76_026167 [Lolium multiflorum]|uniref:SIAH-type domain-containing protein n=1 Tax=Lolium multiflorum TaxID=4521 RepID=A0AAD8RGZ6_LOLMU|nr:hypothetical protein QYE76_026167 [Lolium multiflorum]
MDDNTRKSTADGKRPSSSAEEEAVKRCDVCHGPLKASSPPFTSQRRVACSDCGDADVAKAAINIVSLNLGYFKVPCPNEMYGCGGFAFRDAATHPAVCAHAPLTCPKCAFVGSPAQFARHLADPDGPHVWADWSFGALAEAAIDVVSKHLGYFKVPCPNEEYGCASSFASRDAATHAAVCAHAPCACPGCAYLGSPAQLVRHLTDTAGPHAWPVHDFEYGSDLMLDVRMPQEPQQDKHLLVAEGDGGVFLLAVGGGHATVVCVRSNAGAGPVYSSMLPIPNMAGGFWRCRVPSCSTPSEFEVHGGASSVSVHPGSELHLPIRVCIDRKN